MPVESSTDEGLRSAAQPHSSARPYFDPGKSAWVFTRYRDVFDALREPSLRQEGREKAPPQVRQQVSAALSAKLVDWEKRIDPLARRIIGALPQNRPIELVSEVIRPWSLAVASAVLDLDEARARRLAALAPHLFAEAGAQSPGRRSLKHLLRAIRRRVAAIRLQRLLRTVRVPAVQSLFLGVTQTIPEFLANAWLALLENPTELARLRDEPDLIPRAVEELLRYSGPVHTLVRIADRPMDLAGVRIAGGERVILRMGAANRDPEYFTSPDLLDVARRSAGHVALGGGPHSCVGALLVRIAAISATRAFAERLSGAEIIGPVGWRRGSTLDSPSMLTVLLSRTSALRLQKS